ncbi:MAG: OmpW family protein, partial [Kangiellaceae bacterium]|nr:OmpW family protein [Kangiellaceae bacterium]
MKKTLLSITFVSTLSTSCFADEDWTFRIGPAQVSPDDKSGPVLGNDGVTVDSGASLGFSLAVPLNNKWSFEILAALPFAHDITGTEDLAGLAIGEVEHLPPTFSALYHFGESNNYHVGLGLNYTTFISEESNSALTTALGASTTDLKLDDSTGFALKFGFDIPVT